MSYSWQCPYCSHHSTITDSDNDFISGAFTIDNKQGKKYLSCRFIVCPNSKCKNYTLTIFLFSAIIENFEYKAGSLEKTWNLIPPSEAKVFSSDIVPKVIIEDYEEACLIKDLSPKASATLARRCIQGMIRNFFGVKRPVDHKGPWRLVEEIKAIKDKVDPDVWIAIDGIRKIGNIGAHMEEDVNIIVDVEPEEANKLIKLIELLIEEWYISRYDRQIKVKEVMKLTKNKELQQKKNI